MFPRCDSLKSKKICVSQKEWHLHDCKTSRNANTPYELFGAIHSFATIIASLRAHGIVFGKIEAFSHDPTDSNGIDGVTILELLLSVPEIKHDLQDDRLPFSVP